MSNILMFAIPVGCFIVSTGSPWWLVSIVLILIGIGCSMINAYRETVEKSNEQAIADGLEPNDFFEFPTK